MEKIKLFIIQYLYCITTARVYIISEKDEIISYNGFKDPTLLNEYITNIEAKALVSIFKHQNNNKHVNLEAIAYYFKQFLNKERQYNGQIIHPHLLVLNKNNQPIKLNDIPNNIFEKINEYSIIPYESLKVFINTIIIAIKDHQENIDISSSQLIKSPENSFKKVDIIELCTLLNEAGYLHYNDENMYEVINYFAKMFNLEEICNPKIQRRQLKERNIAFTLADKIAKAAIRLEHDCLW